MHKWIFSMKSNSSGRMLAATKVRHFLQVEAVSRLCRGLKLRLNKPCSGAGFCPLGGVFMALSPDQMMAQEGA
jgi:hypothetical protein